jgi:transposase
MQVLYPRCARLDVHKDLVVARIRCVSEPLHDEVRSFGTTTSALLDLAQWERSYNLRPFRRISASDSFQGDLG